MTRRGSRCELVVGPSAWHPGGRCLLADGHDGAHQVTSSRASDAVVAPVFVTELPEPPPPGTVVLHASIGADGPRRWGGS